MTKVKKNWPKAKRPITKPVQNRVLSFDNFTKTLENPKLPDVDKISKYISYLLNDSGGKGEKLYILYTCIIPVLLLLLLLSLSN